MVDNCTDNEKLTIVFLFCFFFCFVFFFFNNTDVHVSWEIITAEQALQAFLFILIFFFNESSEVH